MSFSTIPFLFFFLPAALLLYYLSPQKVKGAVLVALSLVFYAFGSAPTLLVILVSFAFNYVSGRLIGRSEGRGRKVALGVGVLVNLGVLAFYKYLLVYLHLESSVAGVPLGLSFYTFTVLSYLIDVYRGVDGERPGTEAAQNPLTLAVYVFMFPKLISGPIEPYHLMEKQLLKPDISMENLRSGLVRFLIGLFKKVLLADVLGVVFGAILGLEGRTVITAWLGMFLYALQLYFDFSGYSDMAIGLSKMLGYGLSENFDEPYSSKSITDFWRRWHISLGAWFREYVYIPLGGNRCSTKRQILNLSAVWLLTGLWHGAGLNFIVWGLYHGILIIVERFVLKDRREKWPRPLQIALTFLLVCFGWVFFFSPSLKEAFTYFGHMAGSAGVGLIGSQGAYYFKEALVPLLIGTALTVPPASRLLKALSNHKNQWISLGLIVVMVILFVLCVGEMIGATNQSFMYFQF